MPLVRVQPDDLDQIAAVAGILQAARLVDDPDAYPPLVEELASEMRYGWDLQPDEHFLYVPEGTDSPVATLTTDLPKRDNLKLFWLRLVVHPDHRRRGYGSAIMAEVLRMAEQAGRSILWVEAVEEDAGARKFWSGSASATPATTPGVGSGSPRSTRTQSSGCGRKPGPPRSTTDWSGCFRRWRRRRCSEMIEVTAAINDAPMGELTFEDEVFDLQRMRDVEAAREGRGDQMLPNSGPPSGDGRDRRPHRRGQHHTAPQPRLPGQTPRLPGPTADTGSDCCSRST